MQKKINLQKRSFGLDLLRAVAVLFVPAVHFFMNNYYYSFTMTRPELIITNSFRYLFFNSVPLFIMISGYLKSNKKVSANHYKSIFPILLSYLLISIATTFFRIFYLKEELSTFMWIRNILTFDTPSYAWYVKMYVGLFLLMPFLNNAYNALNSRKQKDILIITMFILTSLPELLNHFKVEEVPLGFVSNYWSMLWPFIYYFIGMYIAEFKPKINKYIGWLIIIILCFAQGLITYQTAKGEGFYVGINSLYDDVTVILASTIIFLCIYDIKCKNTKVHYPIYRIGNVSLSLYLCSFMADRLVYTYTNKSFPEQFTNINHYIWLFPLTQILVVGMSFIAGNIVDLITGFIINFVNLIIKKIKQIKAKKRMKNIDTAHTQEFSVIK